MREAFAAARRPWWARIVSTTGRCDLVHYDIASPRWPLPPLRIATLADPHVAEPWAGLDRLAHGVERINGLGADIVLLLGDYVASRPKIGRRVEPGPIAEVLGRLRAPLGVHAILGNHDWKEDRLAPVTRGRRNGVAEALAAAGLPPLINAAVPVDHGGGRFWLAGFDSQRGHARQGTARHDPEAAYAGIPDGAPTILMAHEPDWFATGDPRPLLQLSGHTHGGQVNLMGWAPMTPSAYGSRYAWGHVTDGPDRQLLIAAGHGFSMGPLRVGVPCEIMLVTLTGRD